MSQEICGIRSLGQTRGHTGQYDDEVIEHDCQYGQIGYRCLVKIFLGAVHSLNLDKCWQCKVIHVRREIDDHPNHASSSRDGFGKRTKQ
jgi:hypothetical protein